MQQQLRQQFVFGVEKRRWYAQRLSQLLGRLELGLMLAPFLLVDTRRGHGGIHAGENAELFLRQPGTLACKREPSCKNRVFCCPPGHFCSPKEAIRMAEVTAAWILRYS